MRKILCLVVAAILAGGGAAALADSASAVIASFGLLGTWANDCTRGVAVGRADFRLILAASPDGGTFHTTVSADALATMTIRSAVVGAVRVGGKRIKLTRRITGGGRNDGPLPSPTTNTFEQIIEAAVPNRIRLVGTDPGLLERCAD